MKLYEIRPEVRGDIAAIRTVTAAAFKNVPSSSQTEAAIVDGLRRAEALRLSLVATEEGEMLGHVAFSPVRISGETGEWYGLGPVSVRPDRQRQGIGHGLIVRGLEELRSRGAGGCVVLGEPAYYGRFGFISDPDLRYASAPPGYFQRLVLRGPSPRGDVSYHPAFDVT